MSTMDQVCDHLKRVGYQVEELRDSDNNMFLAKHDEFANVMLTETHFGILLFTFRKLSPKWKSKEESILESVNEFNNRAGVLRCCIDHEDNLVFQAFMHYAYEESSFGNYLAQILRDLSTIPVNNELVEHLA